MSGTEISETANATLLSALAKKLYGHAALTIAEEGEIGKLAGIGIGPAGLPIAPGGDVEGWNSLNRTNWFNGRFLTAEALRRQDSYFDQRARLDAQMLAPGIAYGLGLEADGLNASPYDQRMQWAFSAEREIVLTPGLAFDMIGRPILVPQSFRFTLADLVTLHRRRPRRVVPGKTEFAPCICLAPEPDGPQGGGPAIRPGPYLLIIEAAEKASGSAQIYGDICGGAQPVTCESDSWTSGFGLSLVRFPVDVPASDLVRTPWDLRGVLSAYYFDVFEHSLIKRWDPPFATDHRFCGPTNPWRHDPGAIALAMVYLADEHSARFVDPWIPRRTIVATPGEETHRTRFGAPPRSAGWARIHQFQCMLSESLEVAPLIRDERLMNVNLFDRGFRHIPPIGFLPIDPALPRGEAITGIETLDKYLAAAGLQNLLVSGLVGSAVEQGLSYFKRTNVLAYATVALHDDDILEDLTNVFDKDPINIDRLPAPVSERIDAIGSNPLTRTGRLLRLILLFGADKLVNRTIEVVKLVVPLQGLERTHPILGVVEEDAMSQLADWQIDAAAAALQLNARSMAALAQRADLHMLPRHFTVYVKQRMVLLDLLLTLWEMIQLVSQVFAPTKTTETRRLVTVKERADAIAGQPAEKRQLAAAVAQYPAFTATLRQALPVVAPDLASPERAKAFGEAVEAQDRKLLSTIPNATERRQAALYQVTDSFAATYPDFEILQMFGAIQPPAATEALVKSIATEPAVLSPLAATNAGAFSDKIAPPPIFSSAAGATIYAEMRDATNALPLQNLGKDMPDTVPADLTVGELLARSPDDAAALVGGTEALAKIKAMVKARITESADAAEAFSKPAPTGLVSKALADALTAHEDPAAAVKAARTAGGTSAQATRFLDRAETVTNILGATRTGIARQIIAGNLVRRST